MTNGWIDIKNTDMMLIMGGNPAENHPCGFKWAIEAKRQRNAKMIVVDPRFTRTAAMADHVPADPRRRRHRVPRRRDSLRARESAHRQRISGQLHQRGVRDQGRLQAARRRPVFRLRRGHARPTTGPPGITRKRAQRQPQPTARRRCPPNVAYDTDARTSALRLSTAEEAVFALHAGDGGAHHRHPEGSVPEGRRPVHVHPQGRRHEEGRDHHLRGRLDAAQLRHADHPHRRDAAIAARQRRPRRRRRERAARALQYSGRHRYGRHLRQPAGLSEGSQLRPTRISMPG